MNDGRIASEFLPLPADFPEDMQQKVMEAKLTGDDEGLEYTNESGTFYVFLPKLNLGGISVDGRPTKWVECSSQDELRPD